MCGFAGLIDTRRRQATHPCRLAEAMAGTLVHRGPDDSGSWGDAEAGVGLAFRRLAIIDLSQAGHQPMPSHDGRFVMIFNGEIYNHAELLAALETGGGGGPWRGHSDTETLLEGFSTWGVGATLRRAVGMFALAVWDRAERRLFLARDRFGEKPLYYGWHGGAFLFGSELQALRAFPGFEADVDRDVLSLYMQFADVPAPHAIYRRTYKLEPGCLLTLTPAGAAQPVDEAPVAPMTHAGLSVERYWSLPEVAARGQAEPIEDEVEALDRLDATLSTAVRLQSIADVPLGAFLSGGIDSTMIVALMQAQSSRPVKTFTIGFDVPGFNEAEHAKAVATHLRTEHTELYLTPEETRDVIPALPRIYSEPFADSSQIPTHLVSTIARRHVTVALSGDAGDELFGGYTRYLWGPRLWRVLRLFPLAVRRPMADAIQAVPIGTWDRLNAAVGGRVARLGDKAHKFTYRLHGVRSVDDVYRMLVTAWAPDSGVVQGARPLPTLFSRTGTLPHLADPESRMMLLDALTYLPDDILHKVDRASMAVSLETRAPFLDHRVADLAWRLPLRMKVRNGETKWIVRRLLDRYVPRELVERPKMGFAVPVETWIRGPLRDWAEALLDERRLAREGYFAPAPIRQKWAEHLSGTRNWVTELWAVLMFQAWLEGQRS